MICEFFLLRYYFFFSGIIPMISTNMMSKYNFLIQSYSELYELRKQDFPFGRR